eukprot:5839729-Pyramimonas_sp.AAC.1
MELAGGRGQATFEPGRTGSVHSQYYRTRPLNLESDAKLTLGDKISYYMENMLAAQPVMKLVWLAIFTFAFMIGLSVLWHLVSTTPCNKGALLLALTTPDPPQYLITCGLVAVPAGSSRREGGQTMCPKTA